MREKEDEIGLEIEHPEIIEKKPPNHKILKFMLEKDNSKVCPDCNTKNLKEAQFCAECGKQL